MSLLKASHSSFISRLINATVDYNLCAIFIQLGSTALVNRKICFWNYSVIKHSVDHHHNLPVELKLANGRLCIGVSLTCVHFVNAETLSCCYKLKVQVQPKKSRRSLFIKRFGTRYVWWGGGDRGWGCGLCLCTLLTHPLICCFSLRFFSTAKHYKFKYCTTLEILPLPHHLFSRLLGCLPFS